MGVLSEGPAVTTQRPRVARRVAALVALAAPVVTVAASLEVTVQHSGNLVVLILSPPDAGADHLKALASISRVLRDRNTVAKLRGARSRDALFALLSGVESRDAA